MTQPPPASAEPPESAEPTGSPEPTGSAEPTGSVQASPPWHDAAAPELPSAFPPPTPIAGFGDPAATPYPHSGPHPPPAPHPPVAPYPASTSYPPAEAYPPAAPYPPPYQAPYPGPSTAPPTASGQAPVPVQPDWQAQYAGTATAPYGSPGYPGGSGYGAPPYAGPAYSAKLGTNGFAIAAFVLSLCGGALLGLIFGIVALVQIRRTGQGGRLLALAGVIISGLWIVVVTVMVAVALSNAANRDSSGLITNPGTVSLQDLRPGDCVNGVHDDQEVTELPAVACTAPHEAEVFALFDLTDSAWPGRSAVEDEAGRGCVDRLGGYAPTAVDDPSLTVFTFSPTETSWALGDRGVACLAVAATGTRTGSIRD